MFQLLELIENEEDREFCRKLMSSLTLQCTMWHMEF